MCIEKDERMMIQPNESGIVRLVHKERADVYKDAVRLTYIYRIPDRAMGWSRLWKQAAKNWRKAALYTRDDLEVARSLNDFEQRLRDEAQATADRRLELLKKLEKKRKICQLCYHVNHTPDCEWGKELADA